MSDTHETVDDATQRDVGPAAHEAVATDSSNHDDTSITDIPAKGDELAAVASATEPSTSSTEHGSDAVDRSSASSRPPRRINPVLWREARTRFETRRTAWLILAYIVVLGGIVALVYTASINGGGGSPAVTRLGVTGRTVFETTLLVTALLIMLLVPAQAASSITGERERQTLMPMQITLLRPSQIVLGKLAAAVIFTVLLITLTAPILALGYVIGGVTITKVFVGVVFLIVIAALTTSIAVWWSTVVRRSATAIVLTMLSLFVLLGGTAIAFTAALSLDGGLSGMNRNAKAPATLWAPNPVMALADAVGESESIEMFDQWGNQIFGGPLTEARNGMISATGGYSGDTMFMPGDGGFGVPATMPAVAESAEASLVGDEANNVSGDVMMIDSSATEMSFPDDVASLDSADGSDVESLSGDATIVFSFGDGDDVPEGMIAVDPNTGEPIDPDRLTGGGGGVIPLWSQFLIFALATMALTTWGASRRLRTPAHSER